MSMLQLVPGENPHGIIITGDAPACVIMMPTRETDIQDNLYKRKGGTDGWAVARNDPRKSVQEDFKQYKSKLSLYIDDSRLPPDDTNEFLRYAIQENTNYQIGSSSSETVVLTSISLET